MKASARHLSKPEETRSGQLARPHEVIRFEC